MRSDDATDSAVRGVGLRAWFGLSLLALLLIGAVIARLYVGSSSIGWPGGEYAGHIMVERSRMLLFGAVVGVALAVSGVALQALLRNALAEPYILGLSTGAGLGITVQIFCVAQFAVYAGPRELGALVGAVLTLGIVFFASRRGGVIDRLGLLLTGVVLSTINGALIMLLHHLTPPEFQRDLMQWMMGLLPTRPPAWGDSAAIGVTVLGLAWLLLRASAMDVATFDDDEAHALGVHGPRLRLGLLITASALAAAAVVIAGPIAFVGLICPHIARLILGPAHRGVLLGSAMLGATLLITANVASELIAHLTPDTIGVLPVGIFTALVGGPAFLWMLRPKLGTGISEG
ncbi:iron ABC transporter permease [Phycisphaeraceae bacterium D3-23]